MTKFSLNNNWYIVFDEKTHAYKALYDKEHGLFLEGSFRYWDDAYHALVKHNVVNKFNHLKSKKMSKLRKAKLYFYYSILLVRNAFL